MKITEFRERICVIEKGRYQVNIAEVGTVLRVANKLLDGELYKLIRKCEKEV